MDAQSNYGRRRDAAAASMMKLLFNRSIKIGLQGEERQYSDHCMPNYRHCQDKKEVRVKYNRLQ
jgi:hypothetical protein